MLPNKNKIFKKLLDDGKRISDLGWIKSMRSGCTGVGYTCETLLGIGENNRQKADYLDLVEIKTKRRNARSRMTLFTLSPRGGEITAASLVNKFGRIKNGKKTLYTTINGLRLNSCRREYGFKINVDRCAEKITLVVVDLNDGTEVLNGSILNFSDLKSVVMRKLSYVCVFDAQSRIVQDVEQFSYELGKIYMLESFDDFLMAIENGFVVMEMRIGVRPDGTVHDHGTAWRISEKKMGELFSIANKNELI